MRCALECYILGCNHNAVRICGRCAFSPHRTSSLLTPPSDNGFGPAPSGSADGDLSDGQLAALLPSLKQPDYYTEPSLQQVGLLEDLGCLGSATWGCTNSAVDVGQFHLPQNLALRTRALNSPHIHCPAAQLAAMARDDPASLGAVANFSVGRRGVGSVRWLEPTDVRGLDLDATVQLSKGSIEVRGSTCNSSVVGGLLAWQPCLHREALPAVGPHVQLTICCVCGTFITTTCPSLPLLQCRCTLTRAPSRRLAMG